MAELGKLGTKMNQVIDRNYHICKKVFNIYACHQKSFQKKTEALMAKLDADGDGKITLEEFRELFKHK